MLLLEASGGLVAAPCVSRNFSRLGSGPRCAREGGGAGVHLRWQEAPKQVSEVVAQAVTGGRAPLSQSAQRDATLW